MSAILPRDIEFMVIHRICHAEYTAECSHPVDITVPGGRIVRVHAMPRLKILTLLAVLNPSVVDDKTRTFAHFVKNPSDKLLDPIKMIGELFANVSIPSKD